MADSAAANLVVPLSRDAIIQQIPFLRLLPDSIQQRLAAKLEEKTYAFGEVIVREGEPADAYYMILSGQVRIVTTRNQREIMLQSLGPGEGFGEMGLLSGTPRNATVRASRKTILLRCARSDFNDAISACTDLRQYLFHQLGTRRTEKKIHTLPPLNQLSPAALKVISDRLRNEFLTCRSEPFQPEKQEWALIIIHSGYFRVLKNEKTMGYLRPGSVFVPGNDVDSLAITLEPLTDVALQTLPPSALAELKKQFPELSDCLAMIPALTATDRLPLDIAAALNAAAQNTSRMEEETADTNATAPVAFLPRTWHFPFVPQLDEDDCGVAALSMICRYFGARIRTSYIRELTGTTVAGTELNAICRAANEIGLRARGVKTSVDKLTDLSLPAIVLVDHAHWVVLTACRRRHVRLADPARGMLREAIPRFLQRWSGHAILFDHSEPMPGTAPRALSFWKRASMLLGAVSIPARITVAASLLSIAIILLPLLFPLITRRLVDEIQSMGTTLHLTRDVMTLGICLSLLFLLTLLQRRVFSRIAGEIDAGVTGFVLRRILALPINYFELRRSTDITRRLETARQLHATLVYEGLNAAVSVVQLFVYIGFMAAIQASLALTFLAMLPLYGLLVYASKKILRPAYQRLEEDARACDLLQSDLIHGLRSIKAAGAEDEFLQLQIREFSFLSQRHASRNCDISAYEGISQALGLFALIVFLWLGLRLIMTQDLSLGGFVASLMLLLMSYIPVLTLLRFWQNLQAVPAQLERLVDLMESRAEPRQSRRQVPSLAGEIRLEKVAFRYGGVETPEILHDLNAVIPPGSRIAIVGANGSGKTTLAKCLAGLLVPTRGCIRFDGLDAAELDPRSLRRHIGAVFQDDHIFNASVMENIAPGIHAPDPERIRRAATLANAHDFFLSLPQGYDTQLGKNGLPLSLGRRQQISLARAFYRNPPILILDEATSALDGESELIIRANLQAFQAERTTIMISHRLETIRHAQQILVLNQGGIAEQGTHEELVRRCGLYCHLFGLLSEPAPTKKQDFSEQDQAQAQ